MKYKVAPYYFCLLMIAVFLLCYQNGYAQKTDSSYAVNVSRIGKILFPVKPHYSAGGDTVYSIIYNSHIYTLAIHSFRGDPDFMLDSGKLKGFYKNFVDQLTSYKKISLTSDRPIVIDGLQAIQLKYLANFKTPDKNLPCTCYHLVLYVNRTIYNFGVDVPDNLHEPDADLKGHFDSFIDSFEITEKAKNLYQFYEVEEDNNTTSSKFADLTVRILVIILEVSVIGVILGLVIKGVIYLYRAIF